MSKVIVYIDGFNLFYGIRSKGWKRYYWLDVHKLSLSLLKPGETLAAVKYFTARVLPTPRDPQKAKRQSTYLDALDALGQTQVTYGHYLTKPVYCPNCKTTFRMPEEKKTDVNIAVALLKDAFTDAYDRAIVISGDSDLVGPIKAVKGSYSKKRITVAFPPGRFSKDLQNTAHGHFTIGRAKIAGAQLPEKIPTPGGFVITRPANWA
jgi:uncharacterized LabA/DUF88 family protein